MLNRERLFSGLHALPCGTPHYRIHDPSRTIGRAVSIAAKDGGTLEYVFDAGEQNSPNAVTKEKVAEIAADFMTTFYNSQEHSAEPN